MSADRVKWAVTGLMLAALWAVGSNPLAAKTVEVEVEEEDVEAVEASQKAPAAKAAVVPPVAKDTAPAAKAAPAAPVPPAAKAASAAPASSAAPMARTRIGDKIGLYYFIKTGFLVPDESKVPAVARVVGLTKDLLYSTPKICYIEVKGQENTLVKGDLLVVYRATSRVREPRSGFSGLWVRNLAVVKVVEVDKKRCLVEVKRSFFPFERGDKLKLYEDEMARWNQAQVKKPLPDHTVKCYVVGLDPSQNLYNQADPIVLTAGSKKGIVEGQVFELREGKTTGFLEPKVSVPHAKARVFYAGPDHSMAQILSNRVPIENGFEAHYQP